MKPVVKITLVIVVAYVCLLPASGCKHFPDLTPDPTNPSDTCDTTLVQFQRNILPLLNSNCAMSGCHDAATHEDGVILTDYTNIINTGEVSPGNPNSSKLYEVLFNTGSDLMPYGGPPLSDDQKALIEKWIQQGAQDYYCPDAACDTSAMSFSSDIMPILNSKCKGCHSGAAPSGGIALTNYAEVMAIDTTGQLAGAINHELGYSAMPQGLPKMDDCTIAKIMSWIHAGSPNN